MTDAVVLVRSVISPSVKVKAPGSSPSSAKNVTFVANVLYDEATNSIYALVIVASAGIVMLGNRSPTSSVETKSRSLLSSATLLSESFSLASSELAAVLTSTVPDPTPLCTSTASVIPAGGVQVALEE